MQACSIEPGGPCKISERWRLIGGTRLPTLDQMAAGAPACRDFLAVISIRRGGRGDDRDRATSGEQQSECL
jgi:hypothetical protein